MNALVLFVFIPSLITADTLCPNSKITCPEDKQCCEVDGEHSCCDPDAVEDVPAGRMKVYPGEEIISHSAAFTNTSLSGNESILHYEACNFQNCRGTCCSYFGCCPHTMADCCAGNKCCPSFSKCCNGGCCGAFQKCCGSGCCDIGHDCCGPWCCKLGYKCGPRTTCVSKGATISSELVTLLLIVASVFISRRL